MFIPDTAITEINDDKLNRAGFAQKLGAQIRDWKGEESIVIALFGPWGSGKTSILNLAISHVEESTQEWESEKHPIIVRFNPWNFSEQNILLRRFFQELFSTINKQTNVLRRDFRESINDLVKALGPFELIPEAGKLVTGVRQAIELVYPEETLEDLKSKISEHFKKLNRRIVIVIDDIDRLNHLEIRQLFQLIKLNADFPNTIYLLAFDRPVVEAVLGNEQNVPGRKYLEKIVQVGFDIPVIEKSYIDQYLFSELDKILLGANDDLWDSVRWGNLYHGGINALFTSLRDVKRFINSLTFNFQIISAEVNPIDFIGIESLRIFIPEVYNGIAQDKALFTQTLLFSHNQTEQNELKSKLENIFNKAEQYQEIAKKICIQLFPKIGSIYQNPLYSSSHRQSDWRKFRRVCAADVFDFYFILGVPKGEISQTELDLINNKTKEADELTNLFREFLSGGRANRLLDYLHDMTDDLDEASARGLCQALLALGEEMPNERTNFWRLDSDFRIALLIYRALQKLSLEDRCDWFLEQISNGLYLFTSVHILWQDTRSQEKTVEPLFSDECYEKLKALCLSQIENKAKLGTLQNTKHLSIILLRWRDWDEKREKLNEFIVGMLSSPRTILDLLEAFLVEGERQTIGDYVSTTESGINLKNLNEFVNLQELTDLLSKVTEEDAGAISERHRISLVKFREASKYQENHFVS